MIERRRCQRYQFTNGPKAALRLADRAVIEELGDRAITVVSNLPGKPGEVVTIDAVTSSQGRPIDACVDQAAPAIVDGTIKHRLRLRPLHHGAGQMAHIVGGLQLTVDVRLLEMSDGGCLLDVGTAVQHGAAGELHLYVRNDVLAEQLRVCRSQLVRGAGATFRVACEFTGGSNNGSSLRRWLARQIEERQRQDRDKRVPAE